MKTIKGKEAISCPKCGMSEGQMKNGKNRSGTQTMLCRHCKKSYAISAKQREYSEAMKELALRMYFTGVSGRGVGKVLHMNKANVYNWIKKRN